MRTQDIIKTGIDRNFIRQCEDHKLIAPQRTDSEWIVNKNYQPRDYSQEELEIIWYAYLCRKMGFSYEQIIQITQGEEIQIRNSLNVMIEKYEKQIEELKALIKFMKYAKGLGFVPEPPTTPLGSTSFSKYLIDFMNCFDEDKRVSKFLSLAECISDIDNIEDIETSKMNHLESIVNDITAGIDEEASERFASAIISLKEKSNLSPDSKEVQSIISTIYFYQKKLVQNENLTAWDFGDQMFSMLSSDSDVSVMYKKLLGETTIEFFIDALCEFLVIQYPDRIKRKIKDIE